MLSLRRERDSWCWVQGVVAVRRITCWYVSETPAVSFNFRHSTSRMHAYSSKYISQAVALPVHKWTQLCRVHASLQMHTMANVQITNTCICVVLNVTFLWPHVAQGKTRSEVVDFCHVHTV